MRVIRIRVASPLDCLGEAYRNLDRYDDAVATGKEAPEIYRGVGQKFGVENPAGYGD